MYRLADISFAFKHGIVTTLWFSFFYKKLGHIYISLIYKFRYLNTADCLASTNRLPLPPLDLNSPRDISGRSSHTG